jgi:hypothetical protein
MTDWRSFLPSLLASACLACPAEAAERRELTPELLLGEAQLAAPVAMREFAPVTTAQAPRARFSGSLRLLRPRGADGFRVLEDATYDRVARYGKALAQLPAFDFAFVQYGDDILPLERGVIRSQHPYWEIILQPGKAWQEAADGGWTRASLPFALQERSANCTHNGIVTWLFDAEGRTSRAVYQVSSETCGYFKFDLWGVADTEYLRSSPDAAAAIERYRQHQHARLPVKPLAALAADYPGTKPGLLGFGDGIEPDDMTVLGMLVDGVHYRSDCYTRQGPYPFCDELPLPSYSTAKSIFAAVAVMRLQKLHGGIANRTVGSLIDECGDERWTDVTIENALDMATGNFLSTRHNDDEDSAPHERFIFADTHTEKLDLACALFPRRAPPGSQFVYHTSDTYLVGAALTQWLASRESGADLYADVVRPLWQRLELGPLLDDAKRSYDLRSQPFTGYGLTYVTDDIARIAEWLANRRGMIGAEAALDEDLLDAALQRAPADRGLRADADNLRYNNGFWAVDARPILDCDGPLWVPFMSGVSGITVAMFPNGVVYYYFSDGYVFSWRSAMRAAHAIRPLCSSQRKFDATNAAARTSNADLQHK